MQFTVLNWFVIFIYFYKLYLSPRLICFCILLTKQGLPLWGKKIEASKASMWKKGESGSLSCVQLFWDPMEYSPPGCSVYGILQAKILEQVSITFSRESSQPRDRTQVSCIAGRFYTIWATRETPIHCMCCAVLSHFSHVWLFVTLWTVPPKAPLSMGFSRQEYCSGLPCPPPGELPDPGIEPAAPVAPALQADSLPLSHTV